MGDKVFVKTFGFDDILSKLEKSKLTNHPDIKYLLNNMGNKVKGDTKKRTPIDTGKLRGSFFFRTNAGKKEVFIGSETDYAAAVEYGTVTGQGSFKPGVKMLNKSVDDLKNIHMKKMVDDFYKKNKREFER